MNIHMKRNLTTFHTITYRTGWKLSTPTQIYHLFDRNSTSFLISNFEGVKTQFLFQDQRSKFSLPLNAYIKMIIELKF
jgi:hypothetical protein